METTSPTPTYSSVHVWLCKRRGKAAVLPCVDCGGSAAHWSLNHDAPAEHLLRDERPLIASGRVWSVDVDDYDPRCIPCHTAYDRPAVS